MVTREALLRAAEQEIDRKYNELAQLRGEIEKLLQKQSDEEQARIVSLVKIYEGMKPADAARIFDTLDIDVLMQVMSKMSERKLSPVMAAMNPERAKTMTIMLAEQKQLPSLPAN
jgi:flagellar motility protein MotE (MotC chaperone)